MSSHINSKVLYCRICLAPKSEADEDFVYFSEGYWIQLYKFCLDIEISSDYLQHIMCKECADQLKSLSEFKQKCEDAEMFWHEKREKETIMCKETLKEMEVTKELLDKTLTDCQEAVIIVVKEEGDRDTTGLNEIGDVESLFSAAGKTNEYLNLNGTSDSKSVDCLECKQAFKNQFAFKRHQEFCKVVVKESKKIKGTRYCGICDHHPQNDNELVRHLNQHYGNNDLKCQVCGFEGEDFAIMLAHRKAHMPVKRQPPLFCVCGSRYVMGLYVEYHFRRAHTGRPGHCPPCRRTFPTVTAWAQHCKQRHNATLRNVYECDYCGLRMSLKKSLIMHIKEEHLKLNSFQCGKCGLVYKQKDKLEKHMDVHFSRAPVVCDHCNKTFPGRRALRRHRAAMAARPHACPHCPKVYCRPHQLQHHLVNHVPQQDYKCDKCSSVFKWKKALKRHVKHLHSKKPLKCEYCGKKFAVQSALEQHMLTHTGFRPHECAECDMTFYSRRVLLKHLKKHNVATVSKTTPGKRAIERNVPEQAVTILEEWAEV